MNKEQKRCGGSREESTDFLCGIGSFRPRCLQSMADRKLVVLFFSIMEISQAMFYSYFRSVITTLEKQFSVSTQTIAFVMAGKEVSQILCGLVLAYYGGRGNRPRWMAAGMVIVAISCLLTISPILFCLEGLDERTKLESSSSSAGSLVSRNLCSLEASTSSNSTGATATVDASCHNSSEMSTATMAALMLIFFGKFVGGVGINMLVTLTFPYLDDNMKKSSSALYIAILTGLRVMGPTLGSLLGGLSLSFPVDLRDSAIDHDDPRWIGAWWLGYLVIGTIFILGSTIVIWFPRAMSQDGNRQAVVAVVVDDLHRRQQAITIKSIDQDISNNNNKDVKNVTKLKGLPSAVKRLLRNKILMCNSFARCFTLFGNNGFDTFQPKYLESHFQQTASSASFLSGLSSNAMRIIGIVAVGVVFRFWRPRAIYVNAWNVFLDIWFIGSLLALMSLSCPNVDFVGRNNLFQEADHPSSQLSCTSNCSCAHTQFSPVCLDGTTSYLSPCHAGCSASGRSLSSSFSKQKTVFYNCSCASDFVESFATKRNVFSAIDGVPYFSVATTGFCAYFCSAFTTYLILIGVQKTFMATRKVGRMLIILRCIDEQDKSLALAVTAILESSLAYIPCPIVYGAFLDAGCILWDSDDGRQGHCWLYDADHMRYVMHGLTAFFMAGATLFDCAMLYLCRDLSFFDADDDGDSKRPVRDSSIIGVSLESNLDAENKHQTVKKLESTNGYSSHL